MNGKRPLCFGRFGPPSHKKYNPKCTIFKTQCAWATILSTANHFLQEYDKIQGNLQIWPPLTVNLLGLLLGDGWVCMIMMEIAETGNSTFVYAKIVPITKNAVQHGVKIKMSPTQNPTILKFIAMD